MTRRTDQKKAAPKRRRKRHENPLVEAINSGAYRPLLNIEDSLPLRTATFLAWAAEKFPGAYVPYNWLYKAINGFRTTPRLESQEVERFRRNTMQAAKRHLYNKYHRAVTFSESGVRACTSDDDLCENPYEAAAKRLANAAENARRMAALIKAPDKMKKSNQEFYARSASTVRRIANPQQAANLLRAPTRKLKAKP